MTATSMTKTQEKRARKIIQKHIDAVDDPSGMVQKEAIIFLSPEDGRLCFGFDGGAFWAFGDSGYDYSAHHRLEALCSELHKLGFDPQRDDNGTLKFF